MHTMGTESLLLEVKRLGRRVKHSTHLTPRLKKEYSYTSTRSLGFHYLLQGESYLKELVIAHEAKNFLIFEVLQVSKRFLHEYIQI